MIKLNILKIKLPLILMKQTQEFYKNHSNVNIKKGLIKKKNVSNV